MRGECKKPWSREGNIGRVSRGVVNGQKSDLRSRTNKIAKKL